MKYKKKVLFICTGNSARSQMAEGLMNQLGQEEWEAKSGGLFPSFVHPFAIRVMEEMGIDISKQNSKSLDQFFGQEFDYLITLCDYAAQTCPAFPGHGKRLHWSLEDPAGAIGTPEERLKIFRKVRDEIKAKIEELIKNHESKEIKNLSS
ncbi:MAG: arsenate reductase ArsC [Thermodesulfobacteriota bacterium]